MSLFPAVLSFFATLVLVNLFFCSLGSLLVILVFISFCVDLMLLEGNYGQGFVRLGSPVAFYCFLLAEFMVFLSFLVSVMWYLNDGSVVMSKWNTLPGMGCVLLFSSTLFLEAFMGGGLHVRGMANLEYVLYCGIAFVFLSVVEFFSAGWSFLDNPHTSSGVLVLLFHLSHVILGLIGLIWWGRVVMVENVLEELLNYNRFNYVMQYWHFVDFVWLFVYVFVYVR